MKFYVSAATDVGVRKQVNQDSLSVKRFLTPDGEVIFAVLCDGMGGLQHGELASKSIVQAFSDWGDQILTQLLRSPLEDHRIRKEWERIVSEQNKLLRSYGLRNGCELGSTVCVLLLSQRRYYILNIGDSRVYEIGASVRQLTQDHTVVAEAVRLKNLTPEQAAKAPMQNVLTRCVGVSETVFPDLFFGVPRSGVTYMLCSDGFRHHISEEELRFYLLRSEDDGEIFDIRQRTHMLIEKNKQRGETDNISVIAIYTQ